MKLRITVDGKEYAVEVDVLEMAPTTSYSAPATARRGAPVQRPSSHHRPSRGPEKTPEPAGDGKVSTSPIAGSVARISVAVGDEVEKDQAILVLEAMKMETEVVSTTQGKVKAIHVKVGEAVKVGQVLVEFE